MIGLSLTGNGYFSPPGGYPFRLFAAGNSIASGVVRKGAVSISAVVRTENGSADVHLAIYEPPATVGGDDGALINQEDITGLGPIAQTITLTLPTDRIAQLYIVRLWADVITGVAARETRDSQTVSTVNVLSLGSELIATGVLVDSMKVA